MKVRWIVCAKRGEIVMREQARERSRARFSLTPGLGTARQKELARGSGSKPGAEKQAEEAAAWKHFVRTGAASTPAAQGRQLGTLLGEPSPARSPPCNDWPDDRRQAEVVWWRS